MGRLSYFMARRYLFAKKSHNVINIISLISAVGIAVGSCALIMVLSIYNGFEHIVRGMYDKAIPDISITSVTSKYFPVDTDAFLRIKSMPEVLSFRETIEETVFLTYDLEEGTAVLKGVDSAFTADPAILECVNGTFSLYHGEVARVVAGRDLAVRLRLRTGSLDPVYAYFPEKDKDISLINPASSLRRETFFSVGTFSSGNSGYNSMLFAPIERVRRLLGVEDNFAGAVELRLSEGADIRSLVRRISTDLGEGFSVKDKYMQNETVYRMMKIEKIVIFTILLFIIIVVSCNVFGSLTMLIIEKRDDIATLKSLGAGDRLIQRIFFDEGWMIILFGAVTGLVTGIILCMVQQYIGVIRMPGNFVVEYYPVVIRFWDVAITLAGIALIGLFITSIPTRKTLSRLL